MTYGNALCVAMRLTDRFTHAPEAKGQNPIPSALEIAGPVPCQKLPLAPTQNRRMVSPAGLGPAANRRDQHAADPLKPF